MQSFYEHFNNTQTHDIIKPGCRVRNCNPKCDHFGSTGIVKRIKKLIDPDDSTKVIGDEVEYECDCDGKSWKPGQILKKTKDQLKVINH